MGSLVVLGVLCGAYSVNYLQPPWRTSHGCTVGIDRDPPVWCSHPGKMMRTPERQLLRPRLRFACGVAHVDTSVGRGMVVLCCHASAPSSNDAAYPRLRVRRVIKLIHLQPVRDLEHTSSSISSNSYRTFHLYRTFQVQGIRDLLRFICGHNSSSWDVKSHWFSTRSLLTTSETCSSISPIRSFTWLNDCLSISLFIISQVL